jgi:hypothetical protein
MEKGFQEWTGVGTLKSVRALSSPGGIVSDSGAIEAWKIKTSRRNKPCWCLAVALQVVLRQ